MKIKLVIIMVMLLSLSGVAAAQTTVSIRNVTVPPGGTVTVPIMINNVTDAASVQVNLTYNGAVVHVTDVMNGWDAFAGNINNASGFTNIAVFQITNPGHSGNVTLANVTFRAVGAGGQSSPLNIEIITLKNSNNEVLPASAQNGTFSITGTISGYKINDTNGDGVWTAGEVGIPGWKITLSNVTGEVANTTTNGNGFYQFLNLAPGNYNVTEETRPGWNHTNASTREIVFDLNFTNLNFTNIQLFNISGYKINDTNGNGVWNAGEAGIQGWVITLSNVTDTLISSTTTDANGRYQFTNIPQGIYNVTEEIRPGWNHTNATNKTITLDRNLTNLNFTNIQLFGISGYKINDTNSDGIWTAGEGIIEGWNITLFNATGTQIASDFTDVNGLYEFTNIQQGTYYLIEETRPGWANTSAANRTASLSQNLTNLNFTNSMLFNISGYKVNDTNNNGIWDVGEVGIPGWNITLFNATGTRITNTTTGADGFYKFLNISQGTYNVTEETKAGWNNTNAATRTITLDHDLTNLNFTNIRAFNISGYKINDTNGDGIWNTGEVGIPGWTITLFNATETLISSVTTDANGRYQFTNILQGTYNITEETRAGWNHTNATNRTITLDQTTTNLNFTNIRLFNISGYKINDTNNNGIWNAGEAVIEGWNITLFNATGAQVSSYLTDVNGRYEFTNIQQGTYYLIEETRAGWINTSGVNRTVTLNQNFTNLNFTNNMLFNITGYKFNDTDGDGTWTEGEPGLSGWNIRLFNATGAQIASNITGADGLYQFLNIPRGNYSVVEDIMYGWVNTSAATINITLDRNLTNLNFLNMVDITSPNVTNASANPGEILLVEPNNIDYGNSSARLNATVTDNSGNISVKINLTPIGRAAAVSMIKIAGNVFSAVTNATAGEGNQTLAINATDVNGNSNTTENISLKVTRNGDVNEDKKTNIVDAMRLAQSLVGPKTRNNLASEVNGDGIIDIADAMYLAKNSIGIAGFEKLR